MNRVASFDPIARSDATVLILGSMPGVRSLAAQQYYTHPQNVFWRLMGALYGFDPAVPYVERVAHLLRSRVAVWDVFRECERIGSLDASIQRASASINDFDAFFGAHPHLERVAFNGGHAQRTFDQHARRRERVYPVRFVTLPSSSPAYTMAYQAKLAAWAHALGLPAPSPAFANPEAIIARAAMRTPRPAPTPRN